MVGKAGPPRRFRAPCPRLSPRGDQAVNGGLLLSATAIPPLGPPWVPPGGPRLWCRCDPSPVPGAVKPIRKGRFLCVPGPEELEIKISGSIKRAVVSVLVQGRQVGNDHLLLGLRRKVHRLDDYVRASIRWSNFGL